MHDAGGRNRGAGPGLLSPRIDKVNTKESSILFWTGAGVSSYIGGAMRAVYQQLINPLRFYPWITEDGETFHVQTHQKTEGGYGHRVAPIGYQRAKGDLILEGEEARAYINMQVLLSGARENY